MSHQNPSIQSFYPPATSERSSSSVPPSSSPERPGDGFTSSEIAAVLNPQVDTTWVPSQEYEEVEIGALVPGPHCVTFQGRIANLYEQRSGSKRARGAKGCYKLILKDDTGCVTVSVKSIQEYSLWLSAFRYAYGLHK